MERTISISFLIPTVTAKPTATTVGQDSYLLAIAQPSGAADAVTPFAEAHVNGNFGDQGGDWSKFAGVSIAQSNDENGGLAEFAIPWSQFNVSDNGLDATAGPAVSDEWFFNVGRISSDGGNLLPIFNHPRRTVLRRTPHGEYWHSCPNPIRWFY